MQAAGLVVARERKKEKNDSREEGSNTTLNDTNPTAERKIGDKDSRESGPNTTISDTNPAQPKNSTTLIDVNSTLIRH